MTDLLDSGQHDDEPDDQADGGTPETTDTAPHDAGLHERVDRLEQQLAGLVQHVATRLGALPAPVAPGAVPQSEAEIQASRDALDLPVHGGDRVSL